MIKVLDVKFYGLDFSKKHKEYRNLECNSYIWITYTKNGVLQPIFKLQLLKGFKTDGASVPWFFRWLLSNWYDEMKKNIAPIVHDAIFATGGELSSDCPFSFEDANKMFFALLTYYEVETNKRRSIAYKAVNSWIGERCYNKTNKYDKYNMKYISWEWL